MVYFDIFDIFVFFTCRLRMAHTSGSSVTSFEYCMPRKVSFESPGLKLRCLGTFNTCWVVLGILEKVLFKKVAWFVLGVS